MTKVIPELENKKEWLSLKEASDLFQKSPHTLKKLIYSEKVKSKKAKGKYGEESRLKLNDLLSYYELTWEDLNHDQKSGYTSGKTNSNNGLDSGNTQELNQAQIIEILKDQIKSLKEDKLSLQRMIDQKDEQLARQQKITENQQSLSLQQNQLLIEDKKGKGGFFGLFSRRNENKNKEV